MSIYLYSLISVLIGYLIGSVPAAWIIGKYFYHKDLRNEGSGNLGATNVARVLGPLPGLTVLLIDSIRCGLISLIMYKIGIKVINDSELYPLIFSLTGIAISLGHTYPIFLKFKGGKGVSCLLGFIVFSNYKILILGFIVFLILALVYKKVSLASIFSAFTCLVASFIPFINSTYLFEFNLIYSITVALLSINLILKHIPNIKRLIKHEENKFKFGKRNK